MGSGKKFLIGIAIGIVIASAILGGALADRLFHFKPLDYLIQRQGYPSVGSKEKLVEREVLREESMVIDIVEKVSPSVVTVGIEKNRTIRLFDPFGFFSEPSERKEKIEQDIGTGFVISSDGLVVTNRHVVEDRDAKYKLITKDDKTYQVEKIYRDPANDLAILKVNPSTSSGLKPLELGDSSNLKVGQFVVAIGTALGEFRNTVTTGVISGLGRGITAGSPFEGYVERLDNVIQTDAAINPGNSGGPLLNSSGQVIGVSVAVASGAENIGFAIPINVVKESLDQFQATGSFSRPFLGVRYKMITKDLAIMNEVPEGAYVVEVVEGSAAEKIGIKEGDIIVKMDGQKITEDDGGLTKVILEKKVGERVEIEVWREGETKKLEAVLEEWSE